MAQQNTRKEMRLSPIGRALHVHLHKPDEYEGKKRYKTKLVLDGDERDEFKGQIEKLIDDAFVELTADKPEAKRKKISKSYPWEEVLDADDNETGELAFKFFMNAEIKTKDGELIERKPLLIDAKRYRLPEGARPIYSGATIRVAYTTRAYLNDATQSVGITLDLHKVQLIKYQDRRDAGPDRDFDEVEGGWTPESSLEDRDDEAPDDDQIPF